MVVGTSWYLPCRGFAKKQFLQDVSNGQGLMLGACPLIPASQPCKSKKFKKSKIIMVFLDFLDFLDLWDG